MIDHKPKDENNKSTTVQNSVLLLAQSIATGGLESQMYAHAKTLKKLGQWKPVVFAYESSKQQDHLKGLYEKSEIEVIIIDKGPGFSLRTVFNILKICRSNKINLIHSNDIGPLIYAALAKIFSFGKIKIIHTQHSFLYVKEKFRYSLYLRFFTKLVDRICTVSEHMFEDYKKLGFSIKKLFSVPNGTDFLNDYPRNKPDKNVYRETLYSSLALQPKNEALIKKLKEKPHWLICLGRVAPEKGQPTLIEIWNNISSKIKNDWVLCIVGPDNLGLFSDQSREGLLNKNIAICGPTNQAQVWYGAADLFASASSFEGAPLAPIEAMTMNLPILLSDIEGHQKLASWGTLFSLSNLENAALSIGEKMNQIYLQDKIENIAEKARKEFSLEKMSRTYQDMYLQICKQTIKSHND
jgi:glycosyltransferase involved in cell wall biosynthesis